MDTGLETVKTLAHIARMYANCAVRAAKLGQYERALTLGHSAGVAVCHAWRQTDIDGGGTNREMNKIAARAEVAYDDAIASTKQLFPDIDLHPLEIVGLGASSVPATAPIAKSTDGRQ